VKKLILALAATALTGCGMGQDPCRDEPAPSEALVAAAQDDAVEVERQGYNEAECVLTEDGAWVDEAELDDEGEDD
jgi:hypothetical protein